ncbi:pyrroline-5-carboxylate reductase 2 isoform X3 [Ptiloglossa arizonensis]|uniref:pyrroline-5-carboxylate reductase 2 isoform X3 n=1 Tax=Ptiloglossa arizonensis TaxID=3350558 RepID=UPI003FA0F184
MTTGLKTMEFLKLSRRIRRRLDVRNVSDQLLADGEKKRKRVSLNIDTKMLKIGFIGGGKMAQALAKGFIRAGLSKGEMMLASCLPNDVGSIDTFKALPDGTPVIRVMPNTPALVGCGATVYARGKCASDKDAEIAEKLFSSVGICEEVPENLIDPVTALAGSGPAYVYMMIEALADGGVKMGLMRPIAYKLAAQTVLGAGTMVRDTKIHPGQLKDDVASPAGSTITGIHYLEEHGMRSAIIGAVEAATKRCREVSSLSDTS